MKIKRNRVFFSMNDELKKLFIADQEDRRNPANFSDSKNAQSIAQRDTARRERVKVLLAQSVLKDGEDYYHAAVIFQHGETTDDYKIANELAKKALDLGSKKAKWLYAATFDRWLFSQGKPQKFGTQFVYGKNGEVQFACPVDPQTTDQERMLYNVPPLDQAFQTFKQKYKT